MSNDKLARGTTDAAEVLPDVEVYNRPKMVEEFPLVGYEQPGRFREGAALVVTREVDGKPFLFDVSSGEPDLPPAYSGFIVERGISDYEGSLTEVTVTRAFFVDASLNPWLEQSGNGGPLHSVTVPMLLGEMTDTEERSKVRSILLREKILEGKKP